MLNLSEAKEPCGWPWTMRQACGTHIINWATHQAYGVHTIEKWHEVHQLKEPHPPRLSLTHSIPMLRIALYIMLEISLIGIVILSTLLYRVRMRVQLSQDIEILTTHLANLILDHTRTPAQLSHDLQMSMMHRSSLTHLSSLTEITEGEFNRLWLSGMRSQRLQNICPSIHRVCSTLHIQCQTSGHDHIRIEWCNPSMRIWLIILLQCDLMVFMTLLAWKLRPKEGIVLWNSPLSYLISSYQPCLSHLIKQTIYPFSSHHCLALWTIL